MRTAGTFESSDGKNKEQKAAAIRVVLLLGAASKHEISEDTGYPPTVVTAVICWMRKNGETIVTEVDPITGSYYYKFPEVKSDVTKHTVSRLRVIRSQAHTIARQQQDATDQLPGSLTLIDELTLETARHVAKVTDIDAQMRKEQERRDRRKAA